MEDRTEPNCGRIGAKRNLAEYIQLCTFFDVCLLSEMGL